MHAIPHAAGCALVLALVSSAPGWGAEPASSLEAAFGNTIVSTHPDGRKARLWLRRDGGYDAQGRAGERSGGVWTVKGEKLCLTQRRPWPIPFSYCKPIPPVAVGKPWRDKAVNGDPVTNEVLPGSEGSSHR
ncbi:MAG TPA: hypothetical protein VG960_02090 [Caulobacteraceae bacterium]|nr:hypothetical protein [Caulobacteraceae bacterium]